MAFGVSARDLKPRMPGELFSRRFGGKALEWASENVTNRFPVKYYPWLGAHLGGRDAPQMIRFCSIATSAECSPRPRLLASPHHARRTRRIAAGAAQLVRSQTADAVQRTLSTRVTGSRCGHRAQTIHGRDDSACQSRAPHGRQLSPAPSRSLTEGRSSSPLPMPPCSRC